MDTGAFGEYEDLVEAKHALYREDEHMWQEYMAAFMLKSGKDILTALKELRAICTEPLPTSIKVFELFKL